MTPGKAAWRFAYFAALLILGCGSSEHGGERMNDPTVSFYDGASSSNPQVQFTDDTESRPGAFTTTKLRVATFNVREFFDTRCDTRACNGSFEEQPSQSIFDAKAKQLALGIESLGADIVLLQEVESSSCLDALVSNLQGPMYSVGEIAETNRPGSLDVALLARGNLLEQFSHTDTEFTLRTGQTRSFARDLQEIHLSIDGKRVIAFNAHFVSKRTDSNGIWREAEAEAARSIILDAARRHPDAFVIFGGDLNDTPDSATLRILEETGGMRRVAEELGTNAGTHTYNERTEALDHLYLVTRSNGAYVVGSASVVRTGERGLAGSDHAALIADFKL